MNKNKQTELVTVKVTKAAAKNFKLASAYSGEPQYKMSEEGSQFVLRKYKSKMHQVRKPIIKTKK